LPLAVTVSLRGRVASSCDERGGWFEGEEQKLVTTSDEKAKRKDQHVNILMIIMRNMRPAAADTRSKWIGCSPAFLSFFVVCCFNLFQFFELPKGSAQLQGRVGQINFVSTEDLLLLVAFSFVVGGTDEAEWLLNADD
jgi:hypothetical protein